jgi:phosphinothricin acetyltransferase
VIRDATAADADACAAIYAPYVRGTAITFETEAPDAAELARRIAHAQERHAWLVAEQDGEVVGYAYAGPLKPRAAYALSCETTVYLRHGLRRTGLGRALTETLLARLTALGLVRAFACIALPNAASVGLHHALGFRDAGVWERAGFKHGEWWDVAWFQKDL